LADLNLKKHHLFQKISLSVAKTTCGGNKNTAKAVIFVVFRLIFDQINSQKWRFNCVTSSLFLLLF
jgi:hypothetical protein